MNWKSWWPLLMCFALTACPDCSDPVDESEIFNPTSFGEYEFDGVPDLDAPEFVLFGDIAVGESGVETIRVQNIGRERLKFSGWTVTDGFDVTYLDVGEEPTELRSNQYVDVVISHTAQSDEEVYGELTIESNDPNDPTWVIGLYVNAKIPCLETDPKQTVDFGDVEMEMETRRSVVFRSCSPNTVTTLRLADLRGDDEFDFVDRDLIQQEFALDPGEEITVDFAFLPADQGDFSAQLDVTSNDGFYPERTLDLIGHGTPGRCPEAIILATHPERDPVEANPNATFQGLPLDTVSLNGMQSRAFDGRRVERWEWRLVQRPTDSTAVFSRTTDDPSNGMFLDLVGEYEVELDVWDSDDIKSCQPARLKIIATADEDIHIQLVWDTPNDPNQLDASGSDVDLHLLHPIGSWNERPYDCFWQNLNPDWATGRNGACISDQTPGCHDDPSLDIDDVDGSGPENINLDNPEPDHTYSVGVHYFSDHGYGRSFVTVRIFIGGVLEREFLRQRLDDQAFWQVGDIAWPSGTVDANGTITNGIPVQ